MHVVYRLFAEHLAPHFFVLHGRRYAVASLRVGRCFVFGRMRLRPCPHTLPLFSVSLVESYLIEGHLSHPTKSKAVGMLSIQTSSSHQLSGRSKDLQLLALLLLLLLLVLLRQALAHALRIRFQNLRATAHLFLISTCFRRTPAIASQCQNMSPD